MTATLKMTHKAIGVEVRRGTYDIVVDGQHAERLRPATAEPSRSDRQGRAFCRSSPHLSLSQAWHFNFAVKSDDRH